MNLAFSGGLVNGARGVVTGTQTYPLPFAFAFAFELTIGPLRVSSSGFASDSSEVTVAGRTSSSGKAKRKKVGLDATHYPVVRFTTGLERFASSTLPVAPPPRPPAKVLCRVRSCRACRVSCRAVLAESFCRRSGSPR